MKNATATKEAPRQRERSHAISARTRPIAPRIATRPRQPVAHNKGVLRIIPIGGCEEVGRNMTVLEYGNDIIIIDMGLQFPEENMPGIDYIIPNISYLLEHKENIRGVNSSKLMPQSEQA